MRQCRWCKQWWCSQRPKTERPGKINARKLETDTKQQQQKRRLIYDLPASTESPPQPKDLDIHRLSRANLNMILGIQLHDFTKKKQPQPAPACTHAVWLSQKHGQPSHSGNRHQPKRSQMLPILSHFSPEITGFPFVWAGAGPSSAIVKSSDELARKLALNIQKPELQGLNEELESLS